MSYHFPTVKETGDKIYFPLAISRVYVDPRNIVARDPDNFERYVFLTNFNESFESSHVWEKLKMPLLVFHVYKKDEDPRNYKVSNVNIVQYSI